MSLAKYQQIVNDLMRDDAVKITDEQRDTAIESARLRYSKDRPHPVVEDIIAPGGHYVDLPKDWDKDFSDIQSIEYPIGEVPPCMMSITLYALYPMPDGLKIASRIALKENAELRVTYTVTHQLDFKGVTIPEVDREAVCCLAAASLCDQLAALYSNDGESTIQADSVDHTSKAGEYAKRARGLRKRYHDELGIDHKKNVAAGVSVNLGKPGHGHTPMTHRRSRR